MDALDRGDVEIRVNELNHALTVIARLKSVLDHQGGGEAATRFDHFYEVARGMLLSVKRERKQGDTGEVDASTKRCGR